MNMEPSSKVYMIPMGDVRGVEYPTNGLEVTVDDDGEIYVELLSNCYDSKDAAVKALRNAADQLEKTTLE
jgi:hypothetical protein